MSDLPAQEARLKRWGACLLIRWRKALPFLTVAVGVLALGLLLMGLHFGSRLPERTYGERALMLLAMPAAIWGPLLLVWGAGRLIDRIIVWTFDQMLLVDCRCDEERMEEAL